MGVISFDGGKTFKTFTTSLGHTRQLYHQFTDSEAKSFIQWKYSHHIKALPDTMAGALERLNTTPVEKAKIEMQYRIDVMNDNIIVTQ